MPWVKGSIRKILRKISKDPRYAAGQMMHEFGGLDYMYVRAKEDVFHTCCVVIDENYEVKHQPRATVEADDNLGVAVSTIERGRYGWVRIRPHPTEI